MVFRASILLIVVIIEEIVEFVELLPLDTLQSLTSWLSENRPTQRAEFVLI